VDVQTCFADLLRGILQGWEGKQELALALDASTLGERFTVLNISVVYRGCGIPIAWKIIKAQQEGEWRAYWEEMLACLAGIVAQDWMVIVMADRGLYAPWLYQAIQRLGWHPMLRVKEDLSFRVQGEENFSPMGTRVERRGRGWGGKGEWSEHGERMQGTVLIRWEKGYEEKLVVVTDLGEREGNAAWYQMRFWIEDEYKDHKSGGWGWEQTKMEDPRRAERLWLAMAVAMLMAVMVGGQEEAKEQEQKCQKTRKLLGKRRVGRPPKPIQRPRGREQSCLMRGQQAIQAAVIRGEEVPRGHVVTEAWPKQTYAVSKPTKSWVKKSREKEAKKRYQKNKQARGGLGEQTESSHTEREPEKNDRPAKPPKQVQRRERARTEREAKRLLTQLKQEERKQRRQSEREERKREQEQKRERRLIAREEREQERQQRLRWHEEIQHERELRLARERARMVSLTPAAQAQPSAVSTIFTRDEALASLPKPP
jgi:Transposase DDE domain